MTNRDFLETALILLATFCFAAAGWPAALSCWRAGWTPEPLFKSALLILLGCLAMVSYLTWRHGVDLFLFLNYAIEITAWSIIVWFWYRPRMSRQVLAARGFVEAHPVEKCGCSQCAAVRAGRDGNAGHIGSCGELHVDGLACRWCDRRPTEHEERYADDGLYRG